MHKSQGSAFSLDVPFCLGAISFTCFTEITCRWYMLCLAWLRGLKWPTRQWFVCSVCGREAEINVLGGIIKYNKLFCVPPDFLSFSAPMSSREEWKEGKGGSYRHLWIILLSALPIMRKSCCQNLEWATETRKAVWPRCSENLQIWNELLTEQPGEASILG